MTEVVLTPAEKEVLLKAIDYCLKACKAGGVESGCPDCETLEKIKQKL
ncbi:hypothetical protein [Carboxydothermus pertinax]|uniref:Uncharacterized protein n=1 Tax=Carboxydothermus pertinax TaxID=870242 RepID=A0A1L8CU47_9THEO|nr:hypothetical protein [Carboxydothermus pertinax]GAV22421.1 hypothetical protein cpu_09310 [Carboxydothermus pertinax]